jgi:hypothetical protein
MKIQKRNYVHAFERYGYEWEDFTCKQVLVLFA